jgi:hypothetical protein
MHGRPMLEYESLKELFILIKVKNNPLKHWLEINGYGIAMANMHDVIFKKDEFVIAKFIDFL